MNPNLLKTAKKLTFDGQSFDCHWQIARSKGQIANGKCQGPMANSQGQIANSKMQWPRAKGQWIGARGKGFHTRNRKKAIKNCEIHENRGFRWQGFRLPDMNCHGSGAKSDLPMPGPKGQPGANCNVQWPGAKGTGAKDFTHPKSKSVKKRYQNSENLQAFNGKGFLHQWFPFAFFHFSKKAGIHTQTLNNNCVF
jgi:hypothetical protein